MKNLILDVGDVLVFLDRSAKDRIIQKHQRENSKEIVGYRDAPDRLINDYGRGYLTSELYIEQLSKIFNVPSSVIKEAEESIFSSVNTTLLDYLATVKTNVRLYILSNTQDIHWQKVIKLLPMDLFHAAFASHEIGLRKPDFRIYQHVSTQIGGSTDDIFFLDDEVENIMAAKAAGWRNSFLHEDNSYSIKWLEERLSE